MEVFVRGSRSDSRDWLTAQSASSIELPQLDQKEKEQARLGHISEERYARTIYAERLTQKRLLQRLQRFGQWLNTKVEERNPAAQIESLELDTLSGRIEVSIAVSGEKFDFEMDEDLVESFLTTGSADSEVAIFRLLEVNVPKRQVARAS